MRIKTYIKQAWALLRQNRLFSALYIVGTGLAVGMTMIMAVIYYVKLAPVYPEVNRFRTYSLSSASFGTERNTYQAGLSYRALQDWALGVKNAEVASVEYQADFAENCYIQPADRTGDFHPVTRLTDPACFRIYAFRFLEGKPFTESDLASGLHVAVITDDLSRRLFGTVERIVPIPERVAVARAQALQGSRRPFERGDRLALPEFRTLQAVGGIVQHTGNAVGSGGVRRGAVCIRRIPAVQEELR